MARAIRSKGLANIMECGCVGWRLRHQSFFERINMAAMFCMGGCPAVVVNATFIAREEIPFSF